MMSVADSYAKLLGSIPDTVKVVVVTKYATLEDIREVIASGATRLGESKVQDATDKASVFSGIKWCMIGHLQSNKVSKAVEVFDCIQSVDSVKLAKKIDARSSTPIKCLVQVNTANDQGQYGATPEVALELIEYIKKELANIDLRGVMTIGSKESPEESFSTARKLWEQSGLPELSMGMSGDYKLAIDNGSTMIRVGRSIFQK